MMATGLAGAPSIALPARLQRKLRSLNRCSSESATLWLIAAILHRQLRKGLGDGELQTVVHGEGESRGMRERTWTCP